MKKNAQGKPIPVKVGSFVGAETDRCSRKTAKRDDTIYSRILSGTWIFPEVEPGR
jgi:hypothetical protein